MSFFIATMPDDAENKVARYTKNAAAGRALRREKINVLPDVCLLKSGVGKGFILRGVYVLQAHRLRGAAEVPPALFSVRVRPARSR